VAPAQVPELDCFFRRRVDNDETIDASFDAGFKDGFFAVDEERVVVAEKDDGCFEAFCAGLFDVVEAFGDVGAVDQRLL
jgi:hypothetical protein